MGRMVLVGVCLALVLINTVIAENSYMFVAPKTIRPGKNLTIQGSLLVTPGQPVLVTVTLEKGKPTPSFWVPEPPEAITPDTVPPEPFTTTQATFVDTNTQKINLLIPDNLVDGNYDLKISGTGGLTFDNTTSLDYESKTASILVQTDKAIYKPGQTVHFRVLGLTPDLKVKYDNMDVELYDPNGNKINQWNVTEKQLQDEIGIFEDQQLMSEQPVLGDWKIKAGLGREQVEKTFTVDEYVLPKFEVTLELEPFGRTKQPAFHGKVIAKYTYGKPVKGVADLRISAKWPRYNWRNNRRIKISKDIEMKMPIDGTAEFKVDMSQLRDVQKYLDNAALIFQANVTETLTGAMMKSIDEEVEFFDNALKMEFPSSLPKSFKPGMVYQGMLKVSERDGSVPNNLNGMVTVNVTHYKPAVTTTSTTTTTTTTTPPPPVMINGELIEPLIAIRPPISIMPPHPWWGPRDQEDKQPPMKVPITADGLVMVPLSIPADVKRVDISAEYKEAKAWLDIERFYSPSDNYMQLKLLQESVKTGDEVQIDVRSTEPANEATYQVLSKGDIVETGKFNLADGLLTLNITADMAPKARVMVYYIRPDGEVVTDGLSFNIEGMYDNKVTINFNQTQAEPNDKIKLMVKADPGSKVNVLAVDKSVLLLKSGNDISHDQVKSELDSYDTATGNSMCGWMCWRFPMSAGGKDADDVFKNAGVVYITDALVHNRPERIRAQKNL